MFEACRTTVQVSRMLETGTDPNLARGTRGRPGSAVDIVAAFHLATAGGGQALDLPIGILAPGYKFDALAIDATAQPGPSPVWRPSARPVFEKLIYGTTRANIAHTWVNGRRVGGCVGV